MSHKCQECGSWNERIYEKDNSGLLCMSCFYTFLEKEKKGVLEFKVNKFITLKLENEKTNIYVNGEIFQQCKYLLLNLENRDFPDFDEIDSMDEAIKLYNKRNETDKTILDPKTEFIGHCSNLQVWTENDYNLKVLHTGLSLPLLRRLVACGDTIAKIAVKEEILERLKSKDEKVLQYFLNEDYLWIFTAEELDMIFEEIPFENQKLLREVNKLINRKYIVDKLKKRKHIIIKTNVPI